MQTGFRVGGETSLNILNWILIMAGFFVRETCNKRLIAFDRFIASHNTSLSFSLSLGH
jgi:hypothetical protein